MTENNISPSYTSLVEWFSSKEKDPKDWRIGTEHEKFIFSLDEQKPVAYEGDAGIEAILRYLSKTYDMKPIKENEKLMRKHLLQQAGEMLESAGFKNVNTYDRGYYYGAGIHEMGTARMGNDPKTSILNKWNQVHSAKNVFVTDGSCMTSASCVNPSITYMALTARAANYAVSELNKRNL